MGQTYRERHCRANSGLAPLKIGPIASGAFSIGPARIGRAWVYELLNGDGEVIYIGCTLNLLTRLGTHLQPDKGLDVAAVRWTAFASINEAEAHEDTLIAEVNPPLNRNQRSNGRASAAAPSWTPRSALPANEPGRIPLDPVEHSPP